MIYKIVVYCNGLQTVVAKILLVFKNQMKITQTHQNSDLYIYGLLSWSTDICCKDLIGMSAKIYKFINLKLCFQLIFVWLSESKIFFITCYNHL